MRALALAMCMVLTSIAGCGASDLCGGVDGPCVAVTVTGNASIDQLAITIDQPTPMTRTTPDPPNAIAFPARFTVKPPAAFGAGASFTLSVDGLSAGVAIAHDEHSVMLDASRHASVTFSLNEGADLGGVDLVGADLIDQCAAVTACMSGDGCCPAGCDSNSDGDCGVCGNGTVEPGEYCDDHNLDNGDTCDPTCQFGNQLSIISGLPGSQSFADGTGATARLAGPEGITTDGTNFYVADRNDDTIRKIDAAGNITTVTGVSRSFIGGNSANETLQSARFDGPVDIEYLGGKLYTLDNAGLRQIDIAANSVKLVVPTFGASARGIGTDGTYILFDDTSSSGDIRGYNPADGSTTYTVVTKANLPSPFVDVAYNAKSAAYVIATDVRLYTVKPAGAVPAAYAGSGTSACGDHTTATLGTFGSINRIAVNSNGDVLVTDKICHLIRSAPFAGGLTSIAGFGTAGWVDNATNARMATLSQPYGIVATSATTEYFTEFDGGLVRRADTGVTTIEGSPPNTTNAYGAKTVARFANTAGSVAANATTVFTVEKVYTSATMTVNTVDRATGNYAHLHDATVCANCAVESVLLLGDLYVSLTDGTIIKVAADGSSDSKLVGVSGTTTAMDGDFTAARLQALAMATDGTYIYFVDAANTIRKIDLSGAGSVSTIAGTAGTTMMVDAVGVNGWFEKPAGLAHANGMLYTSDQHCVGNYCAAYVRTINLATKEVKTIAGHPAPGLEDGIGSAAGLYQVFSIATNGRSLFLVEGFGYGDPYSLVIRQLDLANNRVTTMMGTRGQWALLPGVGAAARMNRVQLTYEPVTKALLLFDSNEQALAQIR